MEGRRLGIWVMDNYHIPCSRRCSITPLPFLDLYLSTPELDSTAIAISSSKYLTFIKWLLCETQIQRQSFWIFVNFTLSNSVSHICLHFDNWSDSISYKMELSCPPGLHGHCQFALLSSVKEHRSCPAEYLERANANLTYDCKSVSDTKDWGWRYFVCIC